MEASDDGLEVPIRQGPQRLMACSDFTDIEKEESDRASPSSDDSVSANGVCQTCLSVCQADCCQVLKQYKTWSSPAVVEGVMFVLIFAYGFMYPVTVQYIYERIWQATDAALINRTLPHAGISQVQQTRDSYSYSCQDLQDNISTTRDVITTKVLDNTAEWEELFSFARNFPPVFVSLTVVSYTDVMGRRFGLVVPTVGSLCAVITYLIISTHSLPIMYLIIASIINGTFGSIACATGCAYAYISDTVPVERRTFRFSLFASIQFAALGLAYMTSSYFIKYLNFGGTFVVIFLLLVCALAYILFVLPESCDIGKKKTIRDFNPVALCISSMLPFVVFTRERDNPQHRNILLLLLVVNLFESAISYGSIEVLSRFVVAPPFCAEPDTVALLQIFAIALAVTGPFIAIKLFSKRLPDAGIGMVASLLSTIGLVIQAFSTNYVTLCIGLIFQLFVPIPNGVSRSIMSKIVAPEEQGALQASVTSARALGGVASAYLCTYVFQATVGSFPGITLIVLSLISLVVVFSFLLTWGLQRDDYENYKLNMSSVRRFAIQRYHEVYDKVHEMRSKKEELSLIDLEDYDSDEVFSQ